MIHMKYQAFADDLHEILGHMQMIYMKIKPYADDSHEISSHTQMIYMNIKPYADDSHEISSHTQMIQMKYQALFDPKMVKYHNFDICCSHNLHFNPFPANLNVCLLLSSLFNIVGSLYCKQYYGARPGCSLGAV